MRSFRLLIIIEIFGAIMIFAAAIILTSPVLIPDARTGTPGSHVRYAPDGPLPGPYC